MNVDNNKPTTRPTTEPKARRVVNGPVKIKKKSGVEKLSGAFISEDASKVKSYIIEDVLIPTIKKTIYDIFTESLNMIFFGGSAQNRSSNAVGKVSYRNYNSISTNNRNTLQNSNYRRTYDYENVIIPSRGEAEAALSEMDAIIDAYGVVKVSDFYEIVGIDGDPTANKYGWMNINSARIERLIDGSGYVIKLPKAVPLD